MSAKHSDNTSEDETSESNTLIGALSAHEPDENPKFTKYHHSGNVDETVVKVVVAVN